MCSFYTSNMLLVSDTPGPTDYNPHRSFLGSLSTLVSLCRPEPVFDAYKRGAFLEQADRFKDPEPQSPLRTNDMNRTKSSRPPAHKPGAPSNDRYALLQRKVDDLEHVHEEGKKAVCYFIPISAPC